MLQPQQSYTPCYSLLLLQLGQLKEERKSSLSEKRTFDVLLHAVLNSEGESMVTF